MKRESSLTTTPESPYEAMERAEAKFRVEEERVHQDPEYLRTQIAYWISIRDWVETLDYSEDLG